MEEAVEWLKRCPNPMPGESDVEIRPFVDPADFGENFTPESLSRGGEAAWGLYISATKKPDEQSFLAGSSGQGLGGLRKQLFGNPDFDLKATRIVLPR